MTRIANVQLIDNCVGQSVNRINCYEIIDW